MKITCCCFDVHPLIDPTHVPNLPLAPLVYSYTRLEHWRMTQEKSSTHSAISGAAPAKRFSMELSQGHKVKQQGAVLTLQDSIQTHPDSRFLSEQEE